MTEREQLVDVMMRALCEHHHGTGAETCDEEQEGDSYIREEMNAILDGIEAAGCELVPTGTRDALVDMVMQFSYDGEKDGQPVLHTGGLSALEGAFAVLGWPDPYALPEAN